MRKELLAGGGLLAALGASSCCVLPLAFGALGLGGAWLSMLAVLAPFRAAFSVAAILLLGAGFWLVYGRRTESNADIACATVPSRRTTKGVLWVGGVMMAAVLSSGVWQRWVT